MTEPTPAAIDSELVIGLVSATGTENSEVIRLLEERLGQAGYSTVLVKISKSVIPLIYKVPSYGRDNYKRISSLMDAGNKARKSFGDEVLARGAAAWIYGYREEQGKLGKALSKTAFIIDSLKRPEEVHDLRLIYPSGFVLIGIHADETQRKDHLVQDLGVAEPMALDLIHRDQEESKVEHGQRVNQTFHLADFFVRISQNSQRLRCDIQRMVELWFGNPFITPTFDEHAMFMAFSSALRSADLSRQVGAVISRDSQILSTGANDCPKAGGGLYWPERRPGDGRISDAENGRDYMRPDGDSNRAEQNRIIKQIVDAAKVRLKINPRALTRLLNESVICDLTEYGRVVHAEMEAILSCARSGLSTLGTTLYSTTFPCHNCAKHIIAAGIDRVVYVEPYPKSKTLDFHDDSISTARDNRDGSRHRVKFHPFVGIGPRRFFDLFSMQLSSSYRLIRKHKDTGEAKKWNIQNAHVRIEMKPTSYLDLEEVAFTFFADIPRIAKSGSAARRRTTR